MPLPESAGTGTIEGEFLVGTSGVPDSGSVTFKPNIHRVSIGDAIVTIPEVTATLDADGRFTVELLATDDPDHNPQGLLYLAVFDLGSGPQWPLRIACPGGETSSFEDVIVRAFDQRHQSIIRGPKGEPGPAGSPSTVPGPPGAAGRGVAGAEMVDDDLVLTYTDGGEDNVGSVRGPQGEPGTPGLNGAVNVEIVDELPALEDQQPGVFYAVTG